MLAKAIIPCCLFRTATVLALLMAVCATGCQSTGGGAIGALPKPSLPNPLEWGADDEASRVGAPERVVATWVDTVLQQPGEPTLRGFGGRIYFYDKEIDPLAVEGRLVVYAFDESDRAPTDHRPTRRFIFPPEQMALHQSESEIGVSYSFWLPWDEVGGEPADVTLIARFEPLDGSGLIVSEPARQGLPGRPGTLEPGTKLAEDKPASEVRAASYNATRVEESKKSEEDEPRKEQPERSLTTTTIRMAPRR